jgi:hypothetical protein
MRVSGVLLTLNGIGRMRLGFVLHLSIVRKRANERLHGGPLILSERERRNVDGRPSTEIKGMRHNERGKLRILRGLQRAIAATGRTIPRNIGHSGNDGVNCIQSSGVNYAAEL